MRTYLRVHDGHIDEIIGAVVREQPLTVYEIRLAQAVTLPTKGILTSGCGGGITFRIDHRLFPRLRSTPRVAPAQLATQMAVALAEQLNLTVCGYVRSGSLNLYAGDGLAVDQKVMTPAR